MRLVPPEIEGPRAGPRATRLALVTLCIAIAPIPAQSRPQSAPMRRAAIMGQVLLPDSAPAAGATVQIFRPRNQSLPAGIGRSLPETQEDEVTAVTCDGEGSFRAHVRPGEILGLLASDAGGLMSELAADIGAGDYAVLRLRPSRQIEGCLASAEGNQGPFPVGHRRVRARFLGSAPSAAVRAAAGWVETRTLPDGGWSLRVPCDVACDVQVLEEERLGGALLASVSEAAAKRIEVQVFRPVRGRVLDQADGTPVAGARVQWAGRPGPVVLTDRYGRFSLERFLGCEQIHVVPKAHEHTIASASQPVITLGSEIQVPVRRQRVRLTGRLLREDGTSLANARAIFLGVVMAYGWVKDVEWVHVLPQDGVLDLGCLELGRMVAGFVEVDGIFVRFLATVPEKDIDLGDVRLSLKGRVEGRVVAPDGSPMAHATVMVQPAARDLEPRWLRWMTTCTRATIADRAGRFVIPGLPPGECDVVGFGPGIGPVLVAAQAAPNAMPLELRLVERESISGRVIDPEGHPVAGALVRALVLGSDALLNRFGDHIPPVVSDAHGRFRLQGLAAEGQMLVAATLARDGKTFAGGGNRECAPGAMDVDIILAPTR